MYFLPLVPFFSTIETIFVPWVNKAKKLAGLIGNTKSFYLIKNLKCFRLIIECIWFKFYLSLFYLN